MLEKREMNARKERKGEQVEKRETDKKFANEERWKQTRIFKVSKREREREVVRRSFEACMLPGDRCYTMCASPRQH